MAAEVRTHNGGIDPMSFEEKTPQKATNPMIFDVPTKSVEQKVYIVLLYGESNDELFDGQFKICHGRTECFRYIERLCQSFGNDFDPFESKVITETKQTETKTENTKYYLINLDEAVSVYSFCKTVEGFYGDNDFKIDDWFRAPSSDEDSDGDPNLAFKEQGVHQAYMGILKQNAEAGAKEGIQVVDGAHFILPSEGQESVNV